MSRITLEQALNDSIASEKAAASFYTIISVFTDDASVREFLQGMAEEERRHCEEIETMAKLLGPGKLAYNAEENLKSIEQAPEWEEIDVSGMKVGEAIRVAVETERQAAGYYESLAKNTQGRVSEFFSAMARAEERHAKNLEKRAFHWYKPTIQWKAPWSDD
jgi:rubrerythrin